MTKTERERLQELACDICHQPYACANEDELAKACENCPISAEMCEMETEEQNWISVTERLPDERKWVLCQCRAKIRMVLRLQNGYWHQDSEHEFMKSFVTHWMPLPEPPEEETDGTT